MSFKIYGYGFAFELELQRCHFIFYFYILFFREIVKLNDENGVIEVVHGKAEDIDLPVKVDIIIR